MASFNYTQGLLHHDSQADKQVMTVVQQSGFFRRRSDLRESALLECRGTAAEPLLDAYLASYFHDGSPEDKQRYWDARKALDEATK